MKQNTWFSAEFELNGLPLLVRYPKKFEVAPYKKKFSNLLLITHTFPTSSFLGLPEAEYNKSLIELDDALAHLFEQNSLGKTVFIETFGSKRIYYIYLSKLVELETYPELVKKNFPEYSLTWDLKKDPEWSLFKSMSEKYEFY